MHLEYVCLRIIAKPISITLNTSEDIAIRCYLSRGAMVENIIFKESVSDSNIWHAPSIHVHDDTPKFSKRLVKN